MMSSAFVIVFKIVTALMHIAGLVLCWKNFGVHKLLTFFLFILILISSIGFGIVVLQDIADAERDREPDISGYVMAIEEEKFFIVSTETELEQGTGDEHYDAAWVLNITKPLQIGEYVQAWFVRDGRGSYPREAMASRVLIIPAENSEEAVAIRSALSSDQVDRSRLHALKTVEYDEQSKMWNVQLVDVLDNRLITIEVSEAD